MKKLFLTSYFADTADLLPPFAGDCSGRRVCLAIPEEVDFYVDEGKAALEKLGMTVDTLDVSAESAAVIAAKLQHCDCIYVSGGNTFFLLQELHKKQADEMLAAQINAGKLYIGESAGAVILAPSVDYMRDMDGATLAEQPISAGLQIVAIYPLPHYGEFPFAEAAAQIVKRYGSELALCPIDNQQVILVDGQQQTIKSKTS